MPIFKIWHQGTKEVSIEEGGSVEEACRKAGWKSEDCEVEVIPDEQITNLLPLKSLGRIRLTGNKHDGNLLTRI